MTEQTKPKPGWPRPGPGAPTKPPETHHRKINVTLDAETARRLDAYQAQVPDYSRSSTIREAIKMYLDWQDITEDDARYEAIRKLLRKAS